MNEITKSFLSFLSGKHKETGQTSFTHSDYETFEGYEVAISELSSKGVILERNDIVGTIDICLPPKK